MIDRTLTEPRSELARVRLARSGRRASLLIRESDYTIGMSTILTATEAAKRFATVLDDLEHGHERVFYVERHGHRVARIEATPAAPRGTRWGELTRALADAPAPDPDFASDVAAARDTMTIESDPWAQS